MAVFAAAEHRTHDEGLFSTGLGDVHFGLLHVCHSLIDVGDGGIDNHATAAAIDVAARATAFIFVANRTAADVDQGIAMVGALDGVADVAVNAGEIHANRASVAAAEHGTQNASVLNVDLGVATHGSRTHASD